MPILTHVPPIRPQATNVRVNIDVVLLPLPSPSSTLRVASSTSAPVALSIIAEQRLGAFNFCDSKLASHWRWTMSDMYTIETSPNSVETESARHSHASKTKKYGQSKGPQRFLAEATVAVSSELSWSRNTMQPAELTPITPINFKSAHRTTSPLHTHAHSAPALAIEDSITVPLSIALQHDDTTTNLALPSVDSVHYAAPTTLTVSAPTPLQPRPPTTTQLSFDSPTFYTSTSTHVIRPSSSPSQASPSSGPHLAVPIIILIGIGGLCLAGGFFILLRYAYWRPRRTTRPVPSKPIPHDFDEEDSPIFGTKERFSSVTKEDAAPSWTQYTIGGKISTELSNSSGLQVKGNDYPFTGTGNSATAGLTGPKKLSDNRQATTTPSADHSASRLSSTPASAFLLSPPKSASPLVIGDITPSINHSKAKLKRNSSALPDVSRASAYGGVELFNPSLDDKSTNVVHLSVPCSASNGSGRARIKTPYTSGHLGHVKKRSSIAYVDTAEDSTDDMAYSVTDTKRKIRRDTRALTAVLEYAEPSSPVETLAPDDSLSVVGMRTSDEPRRREQTKSTSDATAVLGNLMLMDFGPTSSTLRSFKSVTKTPSKRGLGKETQAVASVGPLKVQKKAADEPPRVPSPPPVPSLEQMAMKIANPEEYESYRSPTYSLYACYGGDGKNRLTVTTTTETGP